MASTTKWIIKLRQYKLTGFESNGIIRKPEGSNGASSGNISSIGAKTSSEQAPTAFSSIPMQICNQNMHLVQRFKHIMEVKILIHQERIVSGLQS